MLLRFDDLGMQHRMDAIGEIIMEKGYPTVLCLQATQSPQQYPSCMCSMTLNCFSICEGMPVRTNCVPLSRDDPAEVTMLLTTVA